MSSIWNTLATVRTGKIKLLGSGQQLFGTVIKHGINDKTVTVRVSSCTRWNSKFSKHYIVHKKKQVHDQYNYCVTGDKVIIANCEKLSKTKAYYVKRIVQHFPRPYTEKNKTYITEEQTQQQQNSKKVV